MNNTNNEKKNYKTFVINALLETETTNINKKKILIFLCEFKHKVHRVF